jgi:(p)ppGpp synthase/HD superfamily hydrolase
MAYIALWGRRTARSREVAIHRSTGVAAVLGELNATVEVVLAGILYEVVADLRGESKLLREEDSSHSKIVSFRGL